MHVNIGLLGHFQVTLDGIPARFATDHTRALLAYLAVEARPQERTTLAALLWPEQPESAARQNLRQALLYLKQALQEHPDLASLLEITPKHVHFLRQQATVDLVQFRQLWAECAAHPHESLSACPACVARLRQAVMLYGGEFLHGLFVKNSQPFEEWALFVREQSHRQVLEALQILTLHAETMGDYGQMQQDASRQLTLEPWREEAHRQLMRSLALGGQATAALAHYATCRRVLAEELGVSPSSETTALYEQIKRGAFDQVKGWRGERVTRSPAPPPSSFPHNLPTNLPPMIGRAEQLQQLHRLVLDPAQTLITLVGMGGIGKTRLALALLEHLVAKPPAGLPHGAWFVPLVGVAADQPDLPRVLAEAVLKALRLASSGQSDPQRQLLDALAGQQLLLVLDNFEHFLAKAETTLAATGFIHTLVKSCTGVTVVVTSRSALKLGLEQVVWLEGLPVPKDKTADGASFDSVRLFVQHAQRLLPAFALDADTLSDVIEICRLVNGLPLGIELAATLAPHYSGPEIVRTMRENLSALVSTRRDGDERHRHLSAAFEYSWQLLSTQEQSILAQTTIFVGRFSRAAVQAVTGASVPTIISLVDKSLLQQPASGFYELHEAIRQFAAEKLAQFGAEENQVLRARYVRYYLGLVAQHAAELGQRQPQAIAHIVREHENCRRAWQLAFAHQWFDLVEAALAGWLAYWQATGRYAEGEALVGATLPLLEPVATQPAAPVPVQTLWMHLWLAYADCQSGQQRFYNAAQAAAKATTLASLLGDDHSQAHALITLAESLSWQGRHDEARPFVEHAYALAQQQGLWAVEIRALITLAWYGETFEQRLGTVVQALHIAQRVGDRHSELICTQNLAGACENAGYYARSLAYRAQGLQLAYDAGDRYQIGEAHYLYGLIHTHLGLYEKALEHFQQALTLAQEEHFIWWEKRTLNRMAMVYSRLGRLDEAYQCSSRACAKVRNDEEPSPFFEFTGAQILAAQGRWAEATLTVHRLLQAKRTQVSGKGPRLLPELAALAQLMLHQGDLPQALTLVDEILTILEHHPHFSISDVYFDLFAVYSASYQVLALAKDVRAPALLRAGYEKLCTYADAILDQTLRQSYLTAVVANRELVAAWQASQAFVIPAESTAPLTRPHNLPTTLTPFVGRDQELAELIARLQEPTTRLVTLVGPGGMGKTRLAIEAGRALVPAYADGVYCVLLASLTTATLLEETIATTLGLTVRGDLRQFLLQALRDRQLLLILDNFEHLLSGVEIIIAILQAAPGVQILVTSRERLHLQGEHLWTVQPLPFAQQSNLAEATTSAAVQLFVQSARRVQPGFQVNEGNLRSLLQICTLVQGMPLGLEMAAAWADQLPLAEIAREIEQNADFLAFAWHNVPPRQRSMRGVFAWSWRLLNEVEQRVLRQLALFRGGFTRTAAKNVAGASLPVLASLVNKSLIRPNLDGTATGSGEPQQPDPGRYELHELLRQFAAEQLAALPAEQTAVATRHSEYYLAFVAARAERLACNEPREAVAEIQLELANVRQAWIWAASQAAISMLDQSSYGLWQFFLLAGSFTEGAQAFQTAAALLEAAPPNPAAVVSHQQLLSKVEAIAAYLLVIQSKHQEAQVLVTQASKRSQQCQGIEGESIATLAQALMLYYQGHLVETRQLLEQLLAKTRPAQHQIGRELFADLEFMSWLFLGAIAWRMDEYDNARNHFSQSLAICLHQNKLRGEIHARLNLANLARSIHETATARYEYERVLQLERKLHYRSAQGLVYYELGDVLRLQGNYSQARSLFEQAAAIFAEINDPIREAYAVTHLSLLYSYLGDFQQAQEWLDRFARLDRVQESPEPQMDGLFAGAVLAHLTGDYQQALSCARRARQVAQVTNSRRSQAHALLYCGQAQLALQQFAAAEQAYAQAHQLYQELATPPLLAEAEAGLAQVALAQGDLAQAQTYVAQLLTILADYPYAGIDEPFLIYLTCYRVLKAACDPQAETILQQGYGVLRNYTNQINDPALRYSFVHHVASHWELDVLYRQVIG